MKESNAVTSAKTKQITPEVLEEAIEWLRKIAQELREGKISA